MCLYLHVIHMLSSPRANYHFQLMWSVLREVGFQAYFILWMIVQRFPIGFQPMQLPPHATGGSSLCTHCYLPTGTLFPPPPPHPTSTNRTAGVFKHTEKQFDLQVWVHVVSYISSELYGSCPASWSVSLFLSGMTDWAHQKALELETGSYRHLLRVCTLGDCVPKEPCGPWHGLHWHIDLVGPGNSFSRLRD